MWANISDKLYTGDCVLSVHVINTSDCDKLGLVPILQDWALTIPSSLMANPRPFLDSSQVLVMILVSVMGLAFSVPCAWLTGTSLSMPHIVMISREMSGVCLAYDGISKWII